MKRFLIRLSIGLVLVGVITTGHTQNAAQHTELKPTATEALLTTTVTDEKGRPLANEIVIYQSVKTGKAYKGITDKSGKFDVLVPKGQKYKIKYKIITEWNESSELEIPVTDKLFHQKVGITLEYDAEEYAKSAKPFVLEGLLFDSGRATIRPESYPALDELAEVMRLRSKLKIRLEGHTDNIGDNQANLILSEARAKAVRDYIAAKGVAVERMEVVGLGASKPVADNATAEGRQKNRRTVAIILSGYND